MSVPIEFGWLLQFAEMNVPECARQVRVPSLPALDFGTRVELAVSGLDLLELGLHCEFKRQLAADAPAVAG